MKRPASIVALLLLLAVAPVSAKADEAAIRQAVDAYVQAFNNKDLQAVAATWMESAVHTDCETGERTEGREAIAADIAAALKERPDTQLVGSVDRVRFIKPDVASVDGRTRIVSADQEPVESAFAAIVVNQDGKWLIDSVEEMPVPTPPTAADALRDLEWLVGHWIDESDDARIDTTIDWAPHGAFLLRSFVVQSTDGQTQQGTEVIGWDPRSRQIRSWTFHSDGSFGEATWSRSGDEWLIKSSQTLADGQAASGTFVLSPANDNAVAIQLIGHEIEGEPQPARDPVTVVRVLEEQPPDSAPAADESSE